MVIKTTRSRIRTFLPIALATSTLAAILTGCGGGGDSGAAPAGTQLAFSVAWEQRLTGGGALTASDSAPGPDGAAIGFDTPIPPSVNAIRFIFGPSSGDDCCIAVLRGSQAFIDRRIVLADILPGPSSLEVNGYPTDFAPADGELALCPTRPAGQGTACSGERALPSYGSDEIPVDVLPGITNVVDVDVHSLPFLLDLEPEDLGIADELRPHVSFTVVDAAHGIDSVVVVIQQQDLSTRVEIDSVEECLDGDGELPDCSEGGQLQVRGLRIFSQAQVPLLPGEASLRILARNTASIPGAMLSTTAFLVQPGETSTTTTTDTSTTTTLDAPQTFCLRFSVSNAVDLVGISYSVSYGSTGGEFTGSGENVECFSLLETDPGSTLTTFNDEEGRNTLSTAIISAETFSGPTALSQCEFSQVPPLNLGSFSIQVTEATAPDLSPTSATVVVTETTCPF